MQKGIPRKKEDVESNMVSISGHEIDLREMEDRLHTHECVSNAAVTCVYDNERGELLVATVALKEGYVPSNDLKRELAWHVGIDMGIISLFKDIKFKTRGDVHVNKLRETDENREDCDIYISGHQINTLEVERALKSYYGVANALVVGVPDEKKGELLKAYVLLEGNCVPSNDLKKELAWYVQSKVGPMVYFKDIEFRADFPTEKEVVFEREGETTTRPVQSNMVIVDEVVEEGETMHISSHWISTTEVTMALLRHPDVADAAVVTVPDDNNGETMKAFIKLKEGVTSSNDLRLELAWHVMTDLKPVGVFKSVDIDAQPHPSYSKKEIEKEVVLISDKTVLSVDVENVLSTHELVSAAVVMGIPDKTHGEVLQAFVVLVDGAEPSDELRGELAWYARTQIGPEVVFKSIKFRKFLPKNKRDSLKSLLWADEMKVPTSVSIGIVD